MSEAKRKQRCNEEQLALLLQCSAKRDMTDWNNWREDNPDEEIWLVGANLFKAHLRRAYLWEAHLEGSNLSEAHLEDAILNAAYLQEANLAIACLDNAELVEANFENANLMFASLNYADLSFANLSGANLEYAHLEEASLNYTHLENAHLKMANLTKAFLGGAYLNGANLSESQLEGCDMSESTLHGANFQFAKVSPETLIITCQVDDHTDFTGVALGAARIEPLVEAKLQASMRRKSWTRYTKRLSESGSAFDKIKSLFTRAFWWASDYGHSTSRVLATIGIGLLVFTLLYSILGLISSGDLGNSHGANVSGFAWVLHKFCFAMSTLLTLNMTEITSYLANNNIFLDVLGFIIIIANFSFGYFMLAVLITRIGILFQSLTAPEWKLNKEMESHN